MTAAAFTGSYSNIKLIRSRSVMQIIVEVPIEQAEAVIAAFGVPQPGHERPVAVALFHSDGTPSSAAERGCSTSRVEGSSPSGCANSSGPSVSGSPGLSPPEAASGKGDGQPESTNNDGGSHGTDAHHEELIRIVGALDTRAHNPSPVVRDGGGQPAAPDKLVQRVAILCHETPFQNWLWSTLKGAVCPGDLTTDRTADLFRWYCEVSSRRELSTNPAARQRAEALLLRWDQHCGRAAMDWRSA